MKLRDPALLGALALGSSVLLRRVFRKLGYASAGHGGEGEPGTPEALLGLASVVEASEDAITSATLEGVIISWNPGAERLYGYSAEETVGRSVWELMSPSEGASVVLSNIEKVKREETLGPFDEVHHDRNGRALNVSVILTPIKDQTGEVVGVAAVNRDVSDRKEAEEELKKSEAYYRAALKDQTELICRYLPGGVLTYVNDAYCRYFGKKWEELIGESFLPFLPEEDRERFEEHLYRLSPSNPTETTEHRSVMPDGEVRWQQWTNRAIFDERDRLLEYQGVGRDVTERRESLEALRTSETRLRTVVEQSPLGVHIFAPDGTSLLANAAWDELWYLGEGEKPEGTNVFEDDQLRTAGLTPYIERSVAEGEAVTTPSLLYEPGRTGREGEARWLKAFVYPVRDGTGDVLEVALLLEDTTERKEAEDKLREAETRYRTLVEQIPAVTYVMDPDSGRLTYVSPQLETMLGYSVNHSGLTDEDWVRWVHPDDRERVIAALNRFKESGDYSFSMEYRNVTRGGRVVWVRNEATFVRDEEGRPRYIQGIKLDITERKILEERLEHQAFHDPLTGLANRALFMNRLEHALARVDRRNEPIAVLFMDLDNFKVVNDSLGHEVGDRLLEEVAGRLKECVRPEDTVARFGGDEFVVLLEGIADLGGATRVANRIAETLTDPFDLEGRKVFISTSIGIAPTAEAPDEPEDLLRNADLALYRAKDKGKAQYEIFDVSMGAEALKRLELESALRRALERGEFRIYYQPKISVSDKRIVSLEALVRWEHPERGLLEPNEFLSVAEETGLIVQIGEWVLGEVCRQGREWQERFADYSPPRVCTNISPRQFLRTDLVGKVTETLQDSGLRAQNLSLEIAEGILMDDAGANIEKLEALNDLGIHIVIDDFGTAYSSLAQLKNFPLNILKIDRSLTLKLGESPEDNAIVSAMINLAQALGWAVTAQGVENEEQLRLLRELGCDIVQGYYFTRPVTSEEATVLLENNLSTTI